MPHTERLRQIFHIRDFKFLIKYHHKTSQRTSAGMAILRARFQTQNSVSFSGFTEFLGEFLSAYYLCAKANSPNFSQKSPSMLQNSVRLSESSSPKQYSRNSTPPVSYNLDSSVRSSYYPFLTFLGGETKTAKHRHCQDAFDHDKGQKSAISGLRLHWIFLNILQRQLSETRLIRLTF